MIKNYFKIAFRSLQKNKTYILINTLGLGVALACCITAYLLLAFNIEFDYFHASEKVENVYKIHMHVREKSGEVTQRILVPIPLGPAATEEIAGIDKFTRFASNGSTMRYGDNAFPEGIAFADSTFFTMFDFPLATGSFQNFRDKHSIFLNEKTAKKYFGDEDPVGKTVILSFQNDKEISVTVGGIVGKFPDNTTFTFNALIRFEHFVDIHKLKPDSWADWQQPSTFVSLAPNANVETINKQFETYTRLSNEKKKDMLVDQYHLEPFKSSAFTQDNINGSYVNLRVSRVPLIVFTSMAVLILLIACFNLTNTSIAMTSKRLKEVGIRKTVGAARVQIASQFLLETMLTIVMALFAGVLMSQLIVPKFMEMWQITYGLGDLNGLNLFVALVALVFLASLLAGIYPALFNSKFKPVALLKGAVTINGTNSLTRILVSAQFALSIIMLIAGVVFIENTKFQETINFGYDKDMVVTVGIQNESEYMAMKARMITNPKILKEAASDHQVGWSSYSSPVKIDTAEYQSSHLAVGKNYFETMGFTISEGRAFDPENITEQEGAVMVNRAFLKKTGIEKDPLDRVIVVHDKPRRICGIVENHVENVHNSREPEAFLFYPAEPAWYKNILIRTEPGDRIEVQKYLEKTWKELFPTKPFISHLQEDILLGDSKRTDANLRTIFLFLTFLGGLLSATGIYSLASLNVARRTKEIGVRKALGATAGHIVRLINKEFVIILGLAMAFGSVGGYFATDWLLSEIYAHHVTITVIPVIASALAIFIIGITATSATIVKAAKMNPVKTLRSE